MGLFEYFPYLFKCIFLIVSDFVVKLKGLPFSAKEEDIKTFLENDNIQVRFLNNSRGLPSGLCFVEFDNAGDKEKSFSKHRSFIGSRYIEGRCYIFELIG